MNNLDFLEEGLNELSQVPRAQPAEGLLTAIEQRLTEAETMPLLSSTQRWLWAVAATVLLTVNAWGLYQTLGYTAPVRETLLMDYNLYE